MADTVAEARELIRDRLRAIEEERKRLELALKHLAQTGTSKSSAGRRRRPFTRAGSQGLTEARSRSRRKLAPAGERRRQLIAHLEEHPGARPYQIAKAIETSPANVHNVLRKALAEGAVSKGEEGGYSLRQEKSPRTGLAAQDSTAE
jgi:hypothetical protein